MTQDDKDLYIYILTIYIYRHVKALFGDTI